MAGVRSVEQGLLATLEIIRLIEEKGVFLIPTQNAGMRSVMLATRGIQDINGFYPVGKKKIRMYKDSILKNVLNLAQIR